MSEQDKQQQNEQQAEARDEQVAREEHQDAPEAEPVAGDVESAAEQASEPEQPSVEEELVQTQERLAKVEKALAEADIRAQAEMQNVRRRAERDVESAHKFALEKFAGDILTVTEFCKQSIDPEPSLPRDCKTKGIRISGFSP